MLGAIEFEDFKGLSEMPQEAASAWAEVEQCEMVGASYKPLLYVGSQQVKGVNHFFTAEKVGASYKPLLHVGSQQVKGVNHFFIAEQILLTREPVRRLVTLAINSFDGKQTILPHSLHEIDFEL